MKPVGKTLNKNGEEVEVFECERCHYRSTFDKECPRCYSKEIRKYHKKEFAARIL